MYQRREISINSPRPFSVGLLQNLLSRRDSALSTSAGERFKEPPQSITALLLLLPTPADECCRGHFSFATRARVDCFREAAPHPLFVLALPFVFSYCLAKIPHALFISWIPLVVIAASVFGLFFQVQESRIVENLRKDDHLANAIVNKLDQSPGFKNLSETIKQLARDSSDQYGKIQDQLTKLNRDVGTIDGKLQGLERKVYEAKAAAFGVPNATILRTSLVPTGAGNSFFKATTLPKDPQLVSRFVFTILGEKGGNLSIKVDGEVYKGNTRILTARENIITLRIVPGATVLVPQIVPYQPRLTITFLDRPDPQTAVLALNEETPKRG